MEPPLAKPPRKRPRWLIVTSVLVLVSLASWWCWPRGDARFVGKWAVSAESGVSQTWRFDASGTTHSHDGFGRPERGRWSTRGDHFYFGSSHPGWLEWVTRWCDSKLGFRLLGHQVVYRFTWLDDGSVRLDEGETYEGWLIVRRIPE